MLGIGAKPVSYRRIVGIGAAYGSFMACKHEEAYRDGVSSINRAWKLHWQMSTRGFCGTCAQANDISGSSQLLYASSATHRNSETIVLGAYASANRLSESALHSQCDSCRGILKSSSSTDGPNHLPVKNPFTAGGPGAHSEIVKASAHAWGIKSVCAVAGASIDFLGWVLAAAVTAENKRLIFACS